MFHLPLAFLLPLIKAGKAVGIDEGPYILLVMLASFLLIPVALVHDRIKGTMARHVHGIVWGTIVLVAVNGVNIGVTIAHTVVTYVLIQLLPRRVCGLCVLVLNLAATLACSRWDTEKLLPSMISTVKCSTFAFSVQDFRALSRGERTSKYPHVHEHLKQNALRHEPSLFEFCSYTLFFGSALFGPAFRVQNYFSFQDRSCFDHYGGKTPPRTRAILSVLGTSVMGYLFRILATTFSISNLRYDIRSYSTAQNYLRRFAYLFAWPYFNAYGVWMQASMTELVLILSGAGLYTDSPFENPDWSIYSFSNVKVQVLAKDINVAARGWNCQTNYWIKYSIYYRIRELVPSKYAAMFVSRTVTGLWHGIQNQVQLYFVFTVLIKISTDSLDSAANRLIKNPYLRRKFGLVQWFALQFASMSTTLLFFIPSLSETFYYFGKIHHYNYIPLFACIPLDWILSFCIRETKCVKRE